ncbi:MAG: ABC transporter ATP-binding protein [Paracoccaceae bacterium]
MLKLDGICKTFRLGNRQKVVANNISVVFPSRTSVALLGRNGAGKTSLLRIVAGTMRPDSGRVVSDGTISWPVGFAGSFHPELTGAQNTRFIARVYGVDTKNLSAFVEDFAELGLHFHQPFKTYSSGMRSRLAFGVSMGIHFDTYLVDEVTSVGDAAFREKSKAVFNARLETSGAVVVSHSMSMIKAMCQAAAVLEGGKLTYFDDVDEAIARHEENMKRAAPV